MPRFFFHMEDGVIHNDEEGVDLADFAGAQDHAVRYFAALLRDSSRTFWAHDDWVMRVTDETGLVFFTLHFAATLSAAAGTSRTRA